MGRRLRFRGESRHKVDSKGRVSIPASFRRVLEAGDPDWVEGLNPNLVIVYGNTRLPYIECYTVEEIERIEERIEAMKHGPRRQALEQLYSSFSANAAVDETGRIVLNAKLRERFGIGAEASVVASLNKFQIWDAERYDQDKLAKTEAMFEDLPEDFDPLQWLDEEEDA